MELSKSDTFLQKLKHQEFPSITLPILFNFPFLNHHVFFLAKIFKLLVADSIHLVALVPLSIFITNLTKKVTLNHPPSTQQFYLRNFN